MDLEFVRSGNAPLLLDHTNSVEKTVGVIENVSLRNNKAYASVRMGRDPESSKIKDKIEDKIVRNVSVGYTIEDIEKIDSKGSRADNQYRVTSWTPKEISLVGVPLDINTNILSSKGDSVSENKVSSFARKGNFSRQAMIKMKRLFNLDESASKEKMEEEHKMDKVTVKAIEKDQGSLSASSAKDQTKSFELASSNAKTAEEVLKAERSRSATIFSLSKKFNLDSDFTSELINSDYDENEVRKHVLEKISLDDYNKSKSTNYVVPEQINDHMDKKGELLGQYLGSRISGNRRKMGKEALNNLEKFKTDYVLRWYLGNHNLNNQELFQRLLTTSDFTNVLGDELNKEVQMAYAPEEKNWEPLVERRVVSDLKSIKVVDVDSDAIPKEVQEGAEYETGSISSEKTSYSMKKYGRILLLTEETIINDDLGVLGSTARMIGNKVASLENDTFWGIITTGSFFTSANNNIISSTTTLNAAGIDAARTVIRKQKSLADNQYISIQPRYIIVPEALSGTAMSLFANFVPNVNTNALQFRINGLRGVISDPRLDDDSTTVWYLSGAASEAPLFQRAHLQGQEMPTVTEDEIKSRDSIGYKLKVRFGFANIDHKAIVKVGS